MPSSLPSHALHYHLTPFPLWCRIVLWVNTSNFTMEARYDIHFSLTEVTRYWSFPNPPTGFIDSVGVYKSVENLVSLHDIYFTIQGIK